MRKVLAFIVTIGLLISMLPLTGVVAATEFRDVASHWAKTGILNAVEKGYVNGFPDGTFKPDQSVTRAQFFRMAVDALKLKVEELKPGQQWYSPYVQTIEAANLHKSSDFSSDYNKEMPRAEMVRIIVRAAYRDIFDADDSTLWEKATKNGLIHGSTGGQLLPEGLTTRAQAVAVIERVLSVKAGSKLPVDDRAISYAEIEKYGTNMNAMFGLTPKELPMKLDLVKNMDITIEQIIVVDLDHKDGPYRDWFPVVVKENGEDVGSEYLVALKFRFVNNEARKDLYNFEKQNFAGPIYIRTNVPVELNTKFTSIPIFNLMNLFDREAWYLMTVKKEKVEDWTRKGSMSIFMQSPASGPDEFLRFEKR